MRPATLALPSLLNFWQRPRIGKRHGRKSAIRPGEGGERNAGKSNSGNFERDVSNSPGPVGHPAADGETAPDGPNPAIRAVNSPATGQERDYRLTLGMMIPEDGYLRGGGEIPDGTVYFPGSDEITVARPF